jgi:hypothetical protein
MIGLHHPKTARLRILELTAVMATAMRADNYQAKYYTATQSATVNLNVNLDAEGRDIRYRMDLRRARPKEVWLFCGCLMTETSGNAAKCDNGQSIGDAGEQ